MATMHPNARTVIGDVEPGATPRAGVAVPPARVAERG
jgi:hypothetical protein